MQAELAKKHEEDEVYKREVQIRTAQREKELEGLLEGQEPSEEREFLDTVEFYCTEKMPQLLHSPKDP